MKDFERFARCESCDTPIRVDPECVWIPIDRQKKVITSDFRVLFDPDKAGGLTELNLTGVYCDIKCFLNLLEKRREEYGF